MRQKRVLELHTPSKQLVHYPIFKNNGILVREMITDFTAAVLKLCLWLVILFPYTCLLKLLFYSREYIFFPTNIHH